jgi:hypothetical protein
MIFTAIGTAVLGGSAAVAAAGTSAATLAAVGAGVSAVGTGMLGQAYTARQSALVQERASRAANRRERLKQLASMRQRQRANEFVGVVSGTGGSSSQAGQRGSIASQAAGNIGSSFREQNTASKLSSLNNMQTGFGVLQKAGEFALSMPGLKQDQSGIFGGTKSAPTG